MELAFPTVDADKQAEAAKAAAEISGGGRNKGNNSSQEGANNRAWKSSRQFY